jgi:2-polyprenyl-3-methyl-5-hydroxy-6-metoxy-1,4-benzoquinol methylase
MNEPEKQAGEFEDVEAIMAGIRARARQAAANDLPYVAASPEMRALNESPPPAEQEAAISATTQALTRANELFAQIHERHALARSCYALDWRAWDEIRNQLTRAGAGPLPPSVVGFKGRLKGLAARIGRLFMGAQDSYNEQLRLWMDNLVQLNGALLESLNNLAELRANDEERLNVIERQTQQRYEEMRQMAERRWEEMLEANRQRAETLYASLDAIRDDLVHAPPTDQPGRDLWLKHLLTKGAGTEDFDFLAFEEFTRGPQDEIRRQQEFYAQFFIGRDPVLDIGCGRGEFLELLAARNIKAEGIDLDAQMVRLCQEKGLAVQRAEALAHLEERPEESLGGLFAAQVVEHLTVSELTELCRRTFRALRPGSPIVLETLNPSCLSIFSGALYADPTHVKPVHPIAVRFFLKQAGFARDEVHYSLPTPAEHKLKTLPPAGDAPAEARDGILNENIERLNSILYSCAHYAVVAWKPDNQS